MKRVAEELGDEKQQDENPVLTLAEMLEFAQREDEKWLKIDIDWLKGLAQEPDLVHHGMPIVHEHWERASYVFYNVEMPKRLQDMHEELDELLQVDEDKPKAEDSEFAKLVKLAHYANGSLQKFTEKNSRKKLRRIVVIAEL